jgi:hypothetical protein
MYVRMQVRFELRLALLVWTTFETEPSQIKEVWRIEKCIVLTSILVRLIGGAHSRLANRRRTVSRMVEFGLSKHS